MNYLIGAIFIFSVCTTGQAINCFRCNSTQTLDCLEKFLNPNPLRPESCSDVFEASYCVKTTGIYQGEVGTRRFCSPKDLGNYCEYFPHHDGREYRGCVYTCSSDGCNAAHSNLRASSFTNYIYLLITTVSLLKIYLTIAR